MASYEPPIANYSIFDSLAFQITNSVLITEEDANIRYLARTGIATSNASLTAFAGDVSVGNSTFDYASGTGLTLKTTTSGESIFVNVLSGVTTKQKFELNPNHTHLYDAVRITDSSAPTNYTLLQQSTTTLNIDNQIAGSTTNIKTKTSGGTPVTNLALTETTTGIGTDIILQTATPSLFSGYMGFSVTAQTTISAAMPSGTPTALTGSFSIPVGVYIVMFHCNYNSNVAAGGLTYFSMGLSTSSTSFAGGTGEVLCRGSNSTPVVALSLVSSANAVLTVVAGGTNFYIVGQSNHTGFTVANNTSSYIKYTRIA